MECPSCRSNSLVSARTSYPLKDCIITNVPVQRCGCGEIYVAEDDLKKMMGYVNRLKHKKEVDWSELG
ncbi:hypothetical protein Desaci_4776 (plasmid) [Desulfosporosinus acidiphilus SJ4]|uniref:YgiT-type zinc finger domain protein n=1 Tax=Desulfosporosinus acidiphilus (strain DSM 22704 / JCM 16185 / SJ4) TaxID=646529 RepID=I4DCS7_DESAJ|nr:YgiT-type zinc finger protein [Desulfosporosinus acidiphilus]AFM43601.1 hypothetical protein Desaci_4776 [Desulfosporosinus acidiphilus SJ4]